MRDHSRTIIIAGAGIAGLASALYLARNGFNIIVMEQAKSLDETGAGIQLSPNAMQVLVKLGLDRQIRLASVAPSYISMHSANNAKRIVTIPLGASVLSNYGQPYLSIHRADLHKILFSACEAEPDITVKLDTRVEDHTSHANGASVLATSNLRPNTYSSIGLIGADGVHSAIRTRLLEFQPATITNRMALRTMIPIDAVSGKIDCENISVWLGKDAHLVLYPVNSGSYLNLVATCPAPKGVELQDIDGDQLYQATAKDWAHPLRRLIDNCSGFTAWPLTQSLIPRRWHKGNVGIIGDAAHAMLPHAAQGAAMALEDAAALGAILKPGTSIENAFEQLAPMRNRRLRKLAKLARSNGKIYTMGGIEALVRNFGMRLLGGQNLLRRQHWVYAWKPPTGSNDGLTKSITQ